jgi:hypothetical protein
MRHESGALNFRKVLSKNACSILIGLTGRFLNAQFRGFVVKAVLLAFSGGMEW